VRCLNNSVSLRVESKCGLVHQLIVEGVVDCLRVRSNCLEISTAMMLCVLLDLGQEALRRMIPAVDVDSLSMNCTTSLTKHKL